MKIIISKNKLKALIHNQKKLGFVPTMGSIHLGHISLIKKSISQSKKTIVSIFINKYQFNRKKDYKNYPRTLKSDISKLAKLKIDYLFLPSFKQIYPRGPNKKIKINNFSKNLCGEFRPGHFKSVADVIDRFIKIIKPKKIYLGEKDFQQLVILEKFIKKNHKNTSVVRCKTIREKNGIALSSRNFLLTLSEKKTASKIYKLLYNNKRKIINNKIPMKILKKKFLKLGVKKIDYIKILDVNKLGKLYKKNHRYRIFIAYYLGFTRLIDNF